MDVRYSHPTDIFVLRACYYDDAADLIAVGGDHSVEVLLTVSCSLPRSWRPHALNFFRKTPTSCKSIANFHIGTRITALAWSSNVTSPSSSDDWSIEYVDGTYLRARVRVCVLELDDLTSSTRCIAG